MQLKSYIFSRNLLIILSLILFTLGAFPKIEFATTKPEIKEVMSAYSPGKPNSMSVEPEVVLPPMRAIAQFGAMDIPLPKSAARPICGPSPRINTMNCFDFNHAGVYLQSFPVPGKISSTPLFYENSWLIGTTKGFLMRVEANSDNRGLPKLNKDSINLWGSHSRQVMANFRPKPIYTEDNNSEQATVAQYEPPIIPQNVKWVFPASSSFIGTPIIKNGLVYIYAASQYFQAFNWETGKLVWATRLAPSSNLRLSSDALAVTEKEVIVGNSLGNLLFLNSTTGSVVWTWQVAEASDSQRIQTALPAGPDKFYGIAAPPLIIDRNIIVSNAESMTQRISLDSHSLIWSYPVGSVAQAKAYKNNIFIGANNGKVVSLKQENGAVVWSTDITNTSPIISLFITKNKLLLAATRTGQIFMLDPDTGKILTHNFPIGEVNGEFYAGHNNSEACLSFAANGFRCFRAKL